ncbi:MAG: multifunctional CCA addition/repair protein [Gammaproteobacteria bacterium]
MEIYQVGGAVRDRLLGRAIADRDWVVVGATPEQMLRLGYRQVGRDFPVFLHPETHEEYALARTERKRGSGYHGFEFDTAASVTLEQDLARRDLTINAMAEDADGRVIDPFGGRADLAAGILRHVTPAFVEDPLRVLRVARFAARFGFTIAPETLALMRTLAGSGELATLTPERVWRELERALGEPYPERFIGELRACGALGVLFPEIDRLFGVPQPPHHHPEIDTGIHILRVLAAAARAEASVAVRFALLVHDLGKAETPPHLLPRHPGHEERSARLADALCVRLRVPNALRELAIAVARHHLRIHRAGELRPSTLVDLLTELDAFRRPARLTDVLTACALDMQGRGDLAPRPYPPAAIIEGALAACRTVDTRAIAARGGDGDAIKAAIREARIAAVREARARERP